MNRNQVVDLLEDISNMYGPKFKMNDPKRIVELWHRSLAKEDNEIIRENLFAHMKTNKFPPTVAELVEQKGDHVGIVTPNKKKTYEYLNKRNEWEQADEETKQEAIRKAHDILGGK